MNSRRKVLFTGITLLGISLISAGIFLGAEVIYRQLKGIPILGNQGPLRKSRFPNGPLGVEGMDFYDPGYFDVFTRSRNSTLVYVPKPGFKWGALQINSHGFRDQEYQVKKPKGTFRIVVLGDSIIWGHGLELKDTYPKLLEKTLNSSSNQKVEVLNLGVSGYAPHQEVEFYEEVGKKFKPDLLILGLGLNDLFYSSFEGDFFDLFWIQPFYKRSYLLDAAEVVVFRKDQRNVDLKEQLQKLVDLSPGVKRMILIYPLLKNLRKYPYGELHQKIHAATNEHDYVLVDLFPAFRSYTEEELRLRPNDLIHPGPLGNELAVAASMQVFGEYELLAMPSYGPLRQFGG